MFGNVPPRTLNWQSMLQRPLELLSKYAKNRKILFIVLVCDSASRAYSDFLHTKRSAALISPQLKGHVKDLNFSAFTQINIKELSNGNLTKVFEESDELGMEALRYTAQHWPKNRATGVVSWADRHRYIRKKFLWHRKTQNIFAQNGFKNKSQIILTRVENESYYCT